MAALQYPVEGPSAAPGSESEPGSLIPPDGLSAKPGTMIHGDESHLPGGILRPDMDQFVMPEGPRRDPLAGEGFPGDRGVDEPGVQPGFDLQANPRPDLDRESRVSRRHRIQPFFDIALPQVEFARNTHRGLESAGQRHRLSAHLPCLYGVFRMSLEREPRFGHPGTPPGPYKQPLTESVFESIESRRNRRLGNVQSLRRLVEVTQLHDSQEGSQCDDIHDER